MKIKPLFVLFVLSFINFALLIGRLGFYVDDWSTLYYFHSLGSGGFLNTFLNERPFLGILYSITVPLVGYNTFIWQIISFLTRWLSSVIFYFTLKQIWPDEEKNNFFAAIIFTVFPFFLQHWIAITYSHIYLSGIISMLSMFFMIKALRVPEKRFLHTALSLIFTILYLLPFEYFIGFELVRPFILWIVVKEKYHEFREIIRKVIIVWVPYILLIGIYIVWRFFIFRSEKYNVIPLNEILSSPNHFLTTAQEYINGIITINIRSWSELLNVFQYPIESSSTWIAWGLAVLVGIVLFVVLTKNETVYVESHKENKWGNQVFIAGILLAVGSIIPFMAGGFTISLQSPMDRFFIVFMYGSSLFLTGLIISLVNSKKNQIILICIIIGLSSAFNFRTQNSYALALQAQRQFLWQLYWRVPNLSENTAIISNELPLTYYSENTLSDAINLFYAPDRHSSSMFTILLYENGRLRDYFPEFNPDQRIHICDRSICFDGNTSNSVVVLYTHDGCLRVLDPAYSNQSVIDSSILNEQLINVSNIDRIQTNPVNFSSLHNELFDDEPNHGWCYYYELADLARQQSNWSTITNLWQQAEQEAFSPYQPEEYFPFIESFSTLGQWDISSSLIQQSIEMGANPSDLCQILHSVTEAHPNNVSNEISEILSELGCGN